MEFWGRVYAFELTNIIRHSLWQSEPKPFNVQVCKCANGHRSYPPAGPRDPLRLQLPRLGIARPVDENCGDASVGGAPHIVEKLDAVCDTQTSHPATP